MYSKKSRIFELSNFKFKKTLNKLYLITIIENYTFDLNMGYMWYFKQKLVHSNKIKNRFFEMNTCSV